MSPRAATASLTRRRLLAALGFAAGCGVPTARASAAAPPRRVIFYVTSHGTVHDSWAMRAGHDHLQSYELDLSVAPEDWFSPILRPLFRHRDQIQVVDGVGNPAAVMAGILGHIAGGASSQSGWIPTQAPGTVASCEGPSLDQLVAATRDTPFRSLEWALGGMPTCYDTLGQPLPFEQDPRRAWDRLFPFAGKPGGTQAAVKARQGSVLDLAASRMADLAPSLPAVEREKMEIHRDLVRDLEQRLAWLDEVACASPPSPPEAPAIDDPSYPEVMIPAFLDLAVTAMSCGLTDVVTLRVDDVPTAALGAPPGELHFEVAHAVTTSSEAQRYMVLHHTLHAERVAALLDTLAAIPEGEGSMLDSTLVVWHNELSTGNHQFHTIPMVLAGMGGVIRTGVYQRVVELNTVVGRLGAQTVGAPHNRLLTAIGQALGLTANHTGVLGMDREDGSWLDCTGVLPGVLR